MPKLNARGQAVMGVGASTVSVDGRALIGPAGASCWLTDDTVLCSAQRNGVWEVVVVDADTGETALLAAGANQTAAGAHRWLGWNPVNGVYGSLSRPGAGLVGVGTDGRGAAGLDGTLAYTPDRNSGVGVVLSAPDGTETALPQAVAIDAQVLGPTALLWWDGGPWQAVGTPSPRPALSAGRLRVADVDGERWLVYWVEGTGVIAQVDGATDGYVLESQPLAFNHDAVGVGSDLHVAWSVTPGEAPTDLVSFIVDRTAPRTVLVAPPEPPDPEPPEPPEPPDQPDPGPEPPEPPTPIPEPPGQFPAAIRYGVLMRKTIALRLGQHFASIDLADTFTDGIFAGWWRVQFKPETQTTDANARFELTEPDGLLQIRHLVTNADLGADATEYSGDLASQFYGKPAGDRGGYESWNGWTLGHDGIHIVLIEYDRDGARYGSACLTVVELAD